MLRFHASALSAAAAVIGLGLSGCVDDQITPTGLQFEATQSASLEGFAPPPPNGLVAVDGLQLWPWTGRDLAGTIADPMSVILVGDIDVVSLRAALLALDGDRTAQGFPPGFPFNCTWQDAHGGMQTTYTAEYGWVANAVQLECGAYNPLRFHMRLFDAGPAVVAAVHFDLLIPGTPEHQVLAWDVPRTLALVDIARGLTLAAPPQFVQVNTVGSVQEIPEVVYAGIPNALKVPFGLPPGPSTGPVPIPTDGQAYFVVVGQRPDVFASTDEYQLTVQFDRVIPRPFCATGPTDIVYVNGPVHISVLTEVDDYGILTTHNKLRGDLQVTPIDISTGLPSGPSFVARISQVDNTGAGPNGTHVNAVLQRKALPPGVGFLKSHLVTGPSGTAHFTYSENCD